MRVLLVYTNRYRFMAPPPIGPATLVRPLAERGHEVRLLDLMFAKDPLAALARSLDGFAPDAVGFSIRNVDEQDMTRESTALAEIRPLVQAAARRGLHTVLGGAAFSTLPAELLAFLGAEVGLAGQAETTLPRLVETIGGALDTSLPGLVWRDGDRIRANPPLRPGYAGVRPDWSAYDHRPYRRSMLQAAVVVRSGCAFRCAYCDVPRVFGDRFARRDTESILDDIRRLRDVHGVRVLFLNDPAFNAPLDEAKALLEELVRARLGIYFTTTIVPATGCYDDELWALYRRAGGLLGVFGIEGLSAATLRSYAKPFTIDDVVASTRQAMRAGVRPICTAMLGGPDETDASIDEAVRTIAAMDYTMLQHGFGIRIMPGTALRERAVRDGIVAADDDLLAPRFYLSRELDLPRARRKIAAAGRRHAWRTPRMLPVGLRLLSARLFGVR